MENVDGDMWQYQQPGFRGLLLAELQRQQRGSQFCDIVLRAEGVSVPAHSCVLSALSPQLSCSLPSTPPPTGQRHLLEFGAVRASTLLRLVGLLYSGKITGHGEEEREDILSATARLGISGLVEVRDSGEDRSGRRAVGIQTEPLMLEEGGGREGSDGSTLLVRGTGSQTQMGDLTTDATHLTPQPASGIPDPHHNIPYVPLSIFYPPDGTQNLAHHPSYTDYMAPTEQSTTGGHEPVYYVPPSYSSLIPTAAHYPCHTPAVVYDHATEVQAPEGGGEGFEQFEGNIPGFINYFMNQDEPKCSRGKRRGKRRGGGARGARQTRSGEKRAQRPRGEPKRRGRPPKQMAAAGEQKEAAKSILPNIRLRSWGVQARRSGRGGGALGRMLHLPGTRDHFEPIKLWLKKWSRGKSMKISSVREEPSAESEVAAAAQQLIQEGAHLTPAPEMLHTTCLPSLEPPSHVEQTEQLDRLLDEVMMGLDILDKNNNRKSTRDSHPHPHLATGADNQQECQQRSIIPTGHQETAAGIHNNPTKTVTVETGVGGFVPPGCEVPVIQQQQGEGALSDILDNFIFSFEQQVSNCSPRVRVEKDQSINGQTCTPAGNDVSTSMSSSQSQPCTVDRDQSIAGQSLLAIHAQNPGTSYTRRISPEQPSVAPLAGPAKIENVQPVSAAGAIVSSVSTMRVPSIQPKEPRPVRKPELKLLVKKKKKKRVSNCSTGARVENVVHPQNPGTLPRISSKLPKVSAAKLSSSDVVTNVRQENKDRILAGRRRRDRKVSTEQPSVARLSGPIKKENACSDVQPVSAASTVVSSVSTMCVPSIQPKEPRPVRKPELKLIIDKKKKQVSYCSTTTRVEKDGQTCTPASNDVSTLMSSSQSQPCTVVQPQNPGSQENKDKILARRQRRDRNVPPEQPSVAPPPGPIKRENPKPHKAPSNLRKPEVKLVIRKKRIRDERMEGDRNEQAKRLHSLQPIIRVPPLFIGQCADLKSTVIPPVKSQIKTSVKDYPIRTRLTNQQDKEPLSGEPPLPAKLLTSNPQVVQPIVIKKQKNGIHTVEVKTEHDRKNIHGQEIDLLPVDERVPAISTAQPHVVEHSDVGEQTEERRDKQKEQGRATSPEEGSQGPERKAAKRQREPEDELTATNSAEQATTRGAVQRGGEVSESTNLRMKECSQNVEKNLKETSEPLQGPERRGDKRRREPEGKLTNDSVEQAELTSTFQTKPKASILEPHADSQEGIHGFMEVSSEKLMESEEEGAVEVVNHSDSDNNNPPQDALASEDGRATTQEAEKRGEEAPESIDLEMKESSQKVVKTTRESSEGELQGPERRGDKRRREPEGKLTTKAVQQAELTDTFQTKRKASILEPHADSQDVTELLSEELVMTVESEEEGAVEVLNHSDSDNNNLPQDALASEDGRATTQEAQKRGEESSESIDLEMKESSQKVEKDTRESSEGEFQGPERRGDKRQREPEEESGTKAVKRKRVTEVEMTVSEPGGGTFQSKPEAPVLKPHDSFKDVVEVSSEELVIMTSKSEEEVDVEVLNCSDSFSNDHLYYTLPSEDAQRGKEEASEWDNLKIRESSQNVGETSEELKGTSSDEYIDIVGSDENIDVVEETDVCLQCHYTNLQASPNSVRKAPVPPLHDGITNPPPEPRIPYSPLAINVELGSPGCRDDEEEVDVDIIGWTSPLPVRQPANPPPEPHAPPAPKVDLGSKGSGEDAEDESEVDIIGWTSPLPVRRPTNPPPEPHAPPTPKVDLGSKGSGEDAEDESEVDIIGWASPLPALRPVKPPPEPRMSHLLPLATKVDLESTVSNEEEKDEEEEDVEVIDEEEGMDVFGSQPIECKEMLRNLMLSEREMDNVQIISLLSSPL